MSVVKKPVAMDETLRELVSAVRSQNTAQREMRDLLNQIVKDGVTDDCLQDVRGELEALNGFQKEQRDLMQSIVSVLKDQKELGILFVPITCTEDSEGERSYALDGISFDDLLAAYEDGKFLILKIVCGEYIYFATMADFKNMTVPIGTTQTFTFFSHTLHEEQYTILIYRLTKNDGTVLDNLSVNPSGLAASQITCSVSVGGTTYTTLDEALSAIAAALG